MDPPFRLAPRRAAPRRAARIDAPDVQMHRNSLRSILQRWLQRSIVYGINVTR